MYVFTMQENDYLQIIEVMDNGRSNEWSHNTVVVNSFLEAWDLPIEGLNPKQVNVFSNEDNDWISLAISAKITIE